MLKGLLLFLFTIIVCSSVYAKPQKPVADTSLTPKVQKHLRVSLLKCDVGNETWQTFGHCAIRIVDSTMDSLHRDLTYNYGIYDPFEGSLEKQFLKGRIRVALETAPFYKFVINYTQEGRGVEELLLLLDEDQKEKIEAFLKNNALTENKYYTYHFFFDNCTTRVRDVFPKALGSGFVFAQTIPIDANMTFNDGYNMYFEHKYWYKMLANIFFGSRTDVKMNNYQVMFLPDFMERGLEGATFNGKKVCADKVVIIKSNVPPLPRINVPFILTFILAILTIAGLSFKRLQMLGKVMSIIVLMISGITGIAILYAWFGTEYDLSADNYNILWALPTNIILPFLPPWIQAKYAIIAMGLICASLIVHITGIQVMLLFELVPFWVALFCVYGTMYRNGRIRS